MAITDKEFSEPVLAKLDKILAMIKEISKIDRNFAKAKDDELDGRIQKLEEKVGV